MDLPIACNLTDPQFQQRREELLQRFQGAVLETKELDAGYAYRFPSDANWIADLANFITFRTRVLPVFAIQPSVRTSQRPDLVGIDWPAGTKDFLNFLFGASAHSSSAHAS